MLGNLPIAHCGFDRTPINARVPGFLVVSGGIRGSTAVNIPGSAAVEEETIVGIGRSLAGCATRVGTVAVSHVYLLCIGGIQMSTIARIGFASLLMVLAGSVFADGEEIYNSKCAACHAAGVANAPKLGDKDAWAPRIATGDEAMMAIVMSGKGAMPPKGACGDCSDEDLKAAVDYMVSQAQ